MAVDFPSSPSVNDTHTANGRTWIWNGSAWAVRGGLAGGTTSAPAGSDGQVQYNDGGTTGGTSLLYVDDTNSRIGVNTSSPTVPLDVSGETNTTSLKVNDEYVTPYTGRKNFLINGSMLIAQRATTATSTTGLPGYISLDRWYCSYQDSGSLTIAQNSVNSGGIGKSMRLTVNTSGSYDNSVRIQQAMETVNIIPLQGKTVTISADVKLLTSSATMHELGILYHTSSTDFNGFSGWTSQNLTNVTSQCTTNTWSKVSVTLTVPSNAVSLAVVIGFRAGSGNTGAFAEVSNVQLELGDKATPFEHRSFGEELALCQRYYEKSYSYGVAPGTATAYPTNMALVFNGMTTTIGQKFVSFTYQTPKRAAPTLYSYDGIGTVNKVYTLNLAGQSTQGVSIALSWTNEYSFHKGPGNSTASGVGFHFVAEAEL